MVTKRSVVSLFGKVKMPPKKKVRVDPNATEANLSWIDNKVELLLGVVCAYSSQKEGLEWETESVKSKYEDARRDFVTLYKQLDGLPHDLSLLTRERIASKIEDIRKKYKKAVDSGKKSGGGRTVASFYYVCNEIWGGCPATTSLVHGVDTADFEVIDITAGKPDANPGSLNFPSVVNVPEMNTSVSEESSEVESISRAETPYSKCSTASDQKDHGDATDSKQVSTNRIKLIEHITENRDCKLTKSKPADQQQELSLKKEMVSEMKQMDKEYQQTMARFAIAIEDLSHSVSSAFGKMGTLLQRSQPSYWQPQMPQYMAPQQPLQGDRVLPGWSNDLHFVKDDDYQYASL